MQATKIAAKEPVREMAHILVVDDERSICELLEITFRKEGHRVEIANNVESAKRKLESQIFDIVISDVRMPGETGVDLLAFTKEIAPGTFFLLVTGVPTLDTAIAAINAGADRYRILRFARRQSRRSEALWLGSLQVLLAVPQLSAERSSC